MPNILLIEDDKRLRVQLTNFLESYGHDVNKLEKFDNETVLNNLSNHQLVLLDLTLPDNDGLSICREIRKQSNIPIIIITSKNSDFDEIMSINLGADDFLSKPINTHVLLARIDAIFRRSVSQEISEFILNDLVFNEKKGFIAFKDKQVELTRNEIKLLALLMRNKDQITSRDDLMNELWQSDEFVDENTLTVNINRLRKKIESIGLFDYIKTKRGIGYYL
jgi:DNA-binding response OmpR family regulator